MTDYFKVCFLFDATCKSPHDLQLGLLFSCHLQVDPRPATGFSVLMPVASGASRCNQNWIVTHNSQTIWWCSKLMDRIGEWVSWNHLRKISSIALHLRKPRVKHHSRVLGAHMLQSKHTSKFIFVSALNQIFLSWIVPEYQCSRVHRYLHLLQMQCYNESKLLLE